MRRPTGLAVWFSFFGKPHMLCAIRMFINLAHEIKKPVKKIRRAAQNTQSQIRKYSVGTALDLKDLGEDGWRPDDFRTFVE